MDAIGNVERFIGVCFAIAGPLSALVKWPTSGDSTGLGAGLSAMGLAGSLIIGGMLFYAGRGLLNRSQMSRRIQIGLALIVAYSGSFSIFTYGERFAGAVALCLAMAFVILMFLPSIRTQFVDTNSKKEA